jgi:hypothetical protein
LKGVGEQKNYYGPAGDSIGTHWGQAWDKNYIDEKMNKAQVRSP